MYSLSVALLFSLHAVQASRSLAQSVRVQTEPAGIGSTEPTAPRPNPPIKTINQRPHAPIGSPIGPRPTTAIPLNVQECVELGGSVVLDRDGLCNKGLICRRIAPGPPFLREVCINTIH